MEDYTQKLNTRQVFLTHMYIYNKNKILRLKVKESKKKFDIIAGRIRSISD